MTSTTSRLRLSAACLAISAAVVAAIALTPARAAGGAATSSIVKTVKTRGSTWIAGGGKPMRPGRLSPGNRLLETNVIRRDDGARGVFVATVMVASPRTVAAQRAVGLMRGVYRFRDGDIYVDGFVRFADPSGTGAIVGGTGVYEGARGSFTSNPAQDVLHLQP